MSTRLSRGEMVARLHRAMDAAGSGLSPERTDFIESLIVAGELVVAFKCLATELYEYDLALAAQVFSELAEVGRQLRVADHYRDLLLRSARDE